MFRPFNLTSIAAWTAGAIAGNEAFYAAKGRSAGASITPAKCPPEVRAFLNRLKAIDKECERLINALAGSSLGQGKVNLTPFVHLCAYDDWLQSSAAHLKHEARAVYEASIAEGFIWSSSVIHDVHSAIDTIIVEMHSTANDLRRALDESLETAKQPSMVPVVYKALADRQANCRISQAGKLIDPNKDRIIIQ